MPNAASTIADKLRVASRFERLPAGHIAIDTTARGGKWAGLSPFLLRGGDLYSNHVAQNMENAWQYAKVYAHHADADGNPTEEYWRWATAGWSNPRAVRYPIGKGIKPLYSWWNGERLDYITARKLIYIPLYARAVVTTASFAALRELVERSETLVYLRDYDGYDHVRLGMTISQVIHDPRRKMGHAFVLWMLLTRYLCSECFHPTAGHDGTCPLCCREQTADAKHQPRTCGCRSAAEHNGFCCSGWNSLSQ